MYRQHGFDHPNDKAIEKEVGAAVEILQRYSTKEIERCAQLVFEKGDREIRRGIKVLRWLREHFSEVLAQVRREPVKPSYYAYVRVPSEWR